MRTKTQTLMLRGAAILVVVLVVSGIGGWARHASADDPPAAPPAAMQLAADRALAQTLDATQGELAVTRLQLDRATRIIAFSARYRVPADLAATIYDVAEAEGVDPALAFRLVHVESDFDPRAVSTAGAVGLAQILPSTARLYEPGLSAAQLYDPATNLRLGLRYLHDLLLRYGSLDHALVAYNRGPGKVTQLLQAGKDPRNGYARRVAKGYRGR